ncbi:YoaK family protein [Streptococcus pluranimalium]|uniref:YoaK family protein n=1 Tax=Streptococcus hyovaginalis TaxID=149015 RepID=UPI002A802927|nr:YoaK family protein [Streptococcus hyovaginalis]MDY4511433.1 YoaK family protein [Streptococcus hyovaginalis]MDY5973523.1 YoaK family protein [Streptococcus hyovaginalis]
MRSQFYPNHERLFCAVLVTFVSGFINAFTFLTQGGRFAGVQTGNLLMLGIRLAEGRLLDALKFCLPIAVFMVGQGISYYLKNWVIQRKYHWHLSSSFVLTFMAFLTLILIDDWHPYAIVALLALFMSLQVDTFKAIQGTSFATVMMTGNIKNAAYLWVKGFMEKDVQTRRDSRHILIILGTFSLGAMVATLLCRRYGEMAFGLVLIPLFILNAYLAHGVRRSPSHNPKNIFKKLDTK